MGLAHATSTGLSLFAHKLFSHAVSFLFISHQLSSSFPILVLPSSLIPSLLLLPSLLYIYQVTPFVDTLFPYSPYDGTSYHRKAPSPSGSGPTTPPSSTTATVIPLSRNPPNRNLAPNHQSPHPNPRPLQSLQHLPLPPVPLRAPTNPNHGL
jgi:hypothetical protein